MTNSNYYLFGASGHAKVVVQALEAQGKSIGGLFDANPAITGLLGYPVVLLQPGAAQPDGLYLVAIGNNALRRKLVLQHPSQWGMAVHPTAILSPTTSLGEGSVCFAGAILNADVKAGRHTILNTGCTIDHDTLLGDFVHISPGASIAGGVSVGEGTHIGIGACVIPGISIGKWCTIGAGAVVIRNVPDGAVVVGNPGKIIRIHSPEFFAKV
jgi:sugar O-acyltransferase (sialic acid O-acetyltransferase NeuD family)